MAPRSHAAYAICVSRTFGDEQNLAEPKLRVMPRNRERLNPANARLLIADIDAPFDCDLISFASDGAMLVSAQIAMN